MGEMANPLSPVNMNLHADGHLALSELDIFVQIRGANLRRANRADKSISYRRRDAATQVSGLGRAVRPPVLQNEPKPVREDVRLEIPTQSPIPRARITRGRLHGPTSNASCRDTEVSGCGQQVAVVGPHLRLPRLERAGYVDGVAGPQRN